MDIRFVAHPSGVWCARILSDEAERGVIRGISLRFQTTFRLHDFEVSGSLPHLLALAAGSTIGGNLMITAAASNVTIIQRVEQEGHTMSFRTFD
ncbi:hypothetical protein PJI16_16345 [Nitrospira sp. MA-1]|nr:hypothetical protein [Nitrospira sp. MA-1]